MMEQVSGIKSECVKERGKRERWKVKVERLRAKTFEGFGSSSYVCRCNHVTTAIKPQDNFSQPVKFLGINRFLILRLRITRFSEAFVAGTFTLDQRLGGRFTSRLRNLVKLINKSFHKAPFVTLPSSHTLIF